MIRINQTYSHNESAWTVVLIQSRFVLTAYKLLSIISLPLLISIFSTSASSNERLPAKQKNANKIAIAVFYQHNIKKYNDFLALLEEKLKSEKETFSLIKIDVNQYDVHQLDNYWKKISQQHKKISVAISIGKIATQKSLALRHQINQWSIYLSKTELDKLHKNYKRLGVNVSGIYDEQSFTRQLLLAKAIKPDLKQVVLLFKRNDRLTLPSYIKLAKEENIALNYNILKLTDPADIFFKRLVKPHDVFIITRNSHLYSDNHLKTLVLSAYKLHVTLIGCRLEDVKLGALAAIYTPIEILLDETLSELKNILNKNKINPPRFSKNFHVQLNQQMLNNLNIETLNNKDLTQLIHTMENKRK